ncbi:MAG: cytochrome c peroxidase [Hyphomonadaceae bacterium]
MAAALACVALTGLVACVSSVSPSGEPWPAADLAPPSHADNPPTPVKIELGRRLFYDADLSWDGTVSCATCHEQKRGFTDPNKTRQGFDGAPGERNIQTLANVAWFNSLTWGGPHVDTLEHQALIPIEGFVPVEMGFGGKAEGALAQRLKGKACYPSLFRVAFPERNGELSIDTIVMALSVFQRELVSLDAPYDRYRRGEANAISAQAKRGAALFESKQCASCHAGPHFTDAALPGRTPYEAFHMLAPPAAGKDAGLQRITQKAEDTGKFRTPGLRNVALSAPYMHDGEVATLPDAIRHHFAVAGKQSDPRLKQMVNDAEVADLIAFLEALTDQTFIKNPAYALPKPGCPVPEDDAKPSSAR